MKPYETERQDELVTALENFDPARDNIPMRIIRELGPRLEQPLHCNGFVFIKRRAASVPHLRSMENAERTLVVTCEKDGAMHVFENFGKKIEGYSRLAKPERPLVNKHREIIKELIFKKDKKDE